MLPRAWRARIEDVLEAMDNIALYVSGFDYGAFRVDRKTIDAVERNLEIIGEAVAPKDPGLFGSSGIELQIVPRRPC